MTLLYYPAADITEQYDVTFAIRLMERLEDENIQLRSKIRLLRKRLDEGGRVVVTFPIQ